MKKIQRIVAGLVVFTMIFGLAACSGKKDSEDKAPDKKIEKKADKKDRDDKTSDKKKEKKVGKKDKKDKTSDKKKDEPEFKGEGEVIFTKPQKDDDARPMRRVRIYKYKDNKIISLEDKASIRLQPEGTEVTPENREIAQEVYIDERADVIKQVNGIDIETYLGDERYEQTTIYDYTVLDFDEYDKIRKELGMEPVDDKEKSLQMDIEAKALLENGYTKISESDFKGKGEKTYMDKEGGKFFSFSYDDNRITKITLSVEIAYSDTEYSSKEEAKEGIENTIAELPQIKGVEYSAEYEDSYFVFTKSWDFVKGSFEEFEEEDPDFAFIEEDMYMTRMAGRAIYRGWIEK